MGSSSLDLGEIGDLVHHRPDARQQAQPVFAQRRSSALTVTLSKNSSTGRRKRRQTRPSPARNPRVQKRPSASATSPSSRSASVALPALTQQIAIDLAVVSSRRLAAPRSRRCSRRGDRRSADSRRPRCRGTSASASTRASSRTRSSSSASAKTAAIRSCRTPCSRRCTFSRSAMNGSRQVRLGRSRWNRECRSSAILRPQCDALLETQP